MARKENEFREYQRLKCKEDTEILCRELPSYVTGFMKSLSKNKQPRTRLAYIQDLDIFFYFLKSTMPELSDTPVEKIPIEFLDGLTKGDIDDYSIWLEDYDRLNRYNGKIEHHHNENNGIRRKIASLRTFYNYLRDGAELIKNNPAIKTELPHIHEKNIRTVEDDEFPKIMNVIQNKLDITWRKFEEKKAETGNGSREYKEHAAVRRDLAIIYLFLGAGLRISELVGINLEDVSIDSGRINIVRKGGDEDHIYINGDIEEKLVDYIDNYRPLLCPTDGQENALFLSGHKKRITVRQIEQRVKKYIDLALGENSGLTCHKLRTTFGTIYCQSEGIYATAAVMGHKSVETTRKYYAKQNESPKLKMKEIDFLHGTS